MNRHSFLILFTVGVFLPTFLFSRSFERSIDSMMFYKNRNPNKAIQFGLDAVNQGFSEGPNLELLKTNTMVGQILAEQNLDQEAMKFFNQSLKLFSLLPVEMRQEKKIEFPPWVLINIGNIYFKKRNLEAAKEKYLLALSNFQLYLNEKSKNYGLSTVYDNLALIALSKKDFNEAERYYMKSLAIRQIDNKDEDLIYSKLGLLRLNYDQKNFSEMERIFAEVDFLYEKNKVNYSSSDLQNSFLTRNYGYAQIIMGDMEFARSSYAEGLAIYLRAGELLSNFQVEKPGIQVKIAEFYYKLGRYNQAIYQIKQNLNQIPFGSFISEKKKNLELLALIYSEQEDQKKLLQVKDSLISLYTSYENFSLDKQFNALESFLILSQKQTEINENTKRYNLYMFLLILLTTVMFFLFVSLRLNYNLQKSRAKEVLTEKKLIEADLNNKNITLVNKTNFIAQHNKNLSYLLDSLDHQSTVSKEDLDQQLKGKIEFLLKSFKVNERFENQFEEVYPGFFKSLLNHSSALTQNDLRLCACLRLNQSTKEIALMMGVSVRTIESQKYRLKKKLNLTKKESLINHVFSI